jgi:hypothetical protein
MRVVDVDDNNADGDIADGRQILDAEIAHPSQTVMIVRGSTAAVSKFVDLASVRSDAFPWRSGVWVRDDRIFRQDQHDAWFGGHAQACAVILSLNDQPAEWLNQDADLFDIEVAWLRAEGHA